MPAMAGPLLAVDAPSMLFRAFYALPDSIKGKDGAPVNALLGTANLILRELEQHDPRAVVLCFGPDAADYRVELFDGYHAERPEVPDTLAPQFADSRAFFEGFGWVVADHDSLEADDLLGSYARREAEAGGNALVMTGDRDMYQCAGDRVKVLYIRTGGKGAEVVDAAEVRRRYGIDPEQVPDFIALRGDPSDGIPGAKGIGEKTAAELLRRHGSLQAALDGAVRESKPTVRKALIDQRDELLRFKEIATLQDVDVKLPPDSPTDLAGGGGRGARARHEPAGRALGEGRVRRALLAVVVCLCAVAPAAEARDPGNWVLTGATSIPTTYWQGLTSDPAKRRRVLHRRLRGAVAHDALAASDRRGRAAIPADVKAREGYNHIGDPTWNPGEGGRVLLPMECYTRPAAATPAAPARSASSTRARSAWRYYVKLDPAEIPKAMWAETSPDGKLVWTSSGDDLLAYRSSDVVAANAAPLAPPIHAARRLAGAVPPTGVTGAVFKEGKLLLAGESDGTLPGLGGRHEDRQAAAGARDEGLRGVGGPGRHPDAGRPAALADRAVGPGLHAARSARAARCCTSRRARAARAWTSRC